MVVVCCFNNYFHYPRTCEVLLECKFRSEKRGESLERIFYVRSNHLIAIMGSQVW